LAIFQTLWQLILIGSKEKLLESQSAKLTGPRVSAI